MQRGGGRTGTSPESLDSQSRVGTEGSELVRYALGFDLSLPLLVVTLSGLIKLPVPQFPIL